jgi:hypothetical protein
MRTVTVVTVMNVWFVAWTKSYGHRLSEIYTQRVEPTTHMQKDALVLS